MQLSDNLQRGYKNLWWLSHTPQRDPPLNLRLYSTLGGFCIEPVKIHLGKFVDPLLQGFQLFEVSFPQSSHQAHPLNSVKRIS